MPRSRLLHAALAVLVAGSLGACGSREVAPGERDPRLKNGARLFYDKCAGCHTLNVAAAEGSAYNVTDRERPDGPNFNTRDVRVGDVLYAVRNGGFSGAIMPENIVVGREAEDVALFLQKYSGGRAQVPVTPQQNQPGQTP
jgi:mono/diheme cytochrome c family protein